jgi:hypothetical protein
MAIPAVCWIRRAKRSGIADGAMTWSGDDLIERGKLQLKWREAREGLSRIS